MRYDRFFQGVKPPSLRSLVQFMVAFATTPGELGLGRWERVAGIFAFNVGIESMQLLVVIATMPLLILLSRTRA